MRVSNCALLNEDAVCRDTQSLVSLFSGAGGMDLGFKKAGFNTIWANEHDQAIIPSYKKYFADTVCDERSIRDIPDSDFPLSVAGVIGGPPCQSWSEAGARRGIKDSRGTLFFEYVRVIKRINPLFFVAENVSGILHERHSEFFNDIISSLENIGYIVSWGLLNARDYGVPQDRERVFIVGYHQSLNKKFKFPEPLVYKPTLRDAIGDLTSYIPGESHHSVLNHENTESGYSPIFMSRNRVRSWDEASFTILATDRHIPFHPQAPKMVSLAPNLKGFAPGYENQYRRLTIRECARIQTFPDDYEFIYKHKRHAYKMIGNAVPIELAYWVAKIIKDDLG